MHLSGTWLVEQAYTSQDLYLASAYVSCGKSKTG
jgi:hypothetical protein